MSYQLSTAKIWDGSAWVNAAGGDQPWYSSLTGPALHDVTVTATADATADTKGAWTEVVASTSDEVTAVAVIVSEVGQSGVNTATLFDVGIGSSGSEQVVASNIAVGGAFRTSSLERVGVWVLLPLRIPSGSRVAVRIQSVVTGGKTASMECRFFKWGSGSGVPTSLDVLGSSTVGSKGTSLSGASGTFTEIVGSTSQAYSAIGLVPSMHNASIANVGAYLEVAVGAAGSETVFGVVACMYLQTEIAHTAHSGTFPLFAYDIPAGSRLSVRHNIASFIDRYGVTLIGVPA